MISRMAARRLREEKRQELEALYPALRTPSLTRPVAAATPAPSRTIAARESRIVIGRDPRGLVFSIPDASRFLHNHIVGVPGSGKSNAILHSLKQDILNGAAVVLLDPHGNQSDSVFERTIYWLCRTGAARGRTVHIVDAAAGNHSCGFNPLYCPPDTDPTVIAGNMMEAVERGWGDEDSQEKPTMRRGLRAVFTALSELGLTLLEAPYFLLPADPWNARAWALAQLRDERARAYFERLSSLAADPRMRQTFDIETVGIINRLEEFTSSAAIRRVLGHTRGMDLCQAMDGGDIVLVNLAGGPQLYEREGDLLGRLFLRSLLFNAKRRTNKRPCFVWLDEGHRFLSGDVPNLLEEVRKNAVGLSIVHQDLSQLGKPGDRVREAILAVPQNRFVFRLNSIAEATLLAGEVVELNLERAVESLIKPAVVGHDRVWLRNRGRGTSRGTSIAHGTQSSTTTGTSSTVTHSSGTTASDSETTGNNWSHTDTVGESETVGTTETEMHSHSDGHSGTQSATETASSGAGRSYEYGGGYITPIGPPLANTMSDHRERGVSTMTGESWNESDTITTGTSISHSQTQSRSHADTEGGSHARTTGTARTEGKAHATGRSTAHTHGSSHTIGISDSTSRQQGEGESLQPILRDLPTTVHSLENVKHMAAELISKLPTGTVIVKALVNGKVESGLLRVPRVDDEPMPITSDTKADLIAQTPSALPVGNINAMICERRDWLKAQGATLIAASNMAAAEPKTFRVARPGKGGSRNAVE
jgi:hypothetical protein